MQKLILLILSLITFFSQAQKTVTEDLLLTPEKSNFVKTSTHSEVMSFIDAIKTKSSNLHVLSMGKSKEGKDIPVVILAKPAIKTVEEAKASGKLVVYIQGNIHAGEVEGKEAVMMLMRDILLGEKNYLLDNQIILFAPIYNTDSNDKMAKGLRLSQEDSPLETGLRENSQGLDLNRDGIKMEAFETNGLFPNIINVWDPQLFVDLHTTNGTWHAWNLTWAPSYHSGGEKSTYDYTVNNMLKPITETVKKKYDLNFGPYGDYDVQQAWPLKNFYTYNHHPRYLVNQFGLRNRMAILSETFAHERFYQRIFSSYSFASEILEHTNAHSKEIIDINKKAEEQTVQKFKNSTGKEKKGVRFKMVPLEKINNFPTYDYVSYNKADGSKGYYRTGSIVAYNDVDYYAKFDAEVESTIPRGYVIPAAFVSVVENLKKHGIQVTALTKSQSFSGEVFQVEKYEKSQRKFEGHFMGRATGKFAPSKKSFKKGDYLVDLAQPLGNLAFYILEAESDDGLVTWNFFDEYFEKNGVNNKKVDYPVFKYYN
ncbi:MAG TPA: M14 family metallopeptidase, partial [Cyclobacteriaceae bacterium]